MVIMVYGLLWVMQEFLSSTVSFGPALKQASFERVATQAKVAQTLKTGTGCSSSTGLPCSFYGLLIKLELPKTLKP